MRKLNQYIEDYKLLHINAAEELSLVRDNLDTQIAQLGRQREQ